MAPRLFLLILLAPLVASASDARAAAPADVPPCPGTEEKPDVGLLVKRIERLMEGRSSVSTITMTIRTPQWNRALKLKIWAKGRDLALVRVLEGGPRETGMMTLKRERQIWNWLPQAGRVMKLPSGMMGDSWMGSDLTNDDLVRGTSLVDDFTATLEGVVKRDDGDAWRVTLVPKADASVVWGRIELVIDRARCVPLEERFFDDEGKPARRLTFGDFRESGWRWIPGRTTVAPEGEGRETVMQYVEQAFDVDVPDDTFSLARLRQGR